MEEVHTQRVHVWRKSTHGPSKNTRFNKDNHPSPTAQTHARPAFPWTIFDAHMIGFSLKNTILRPPEHTPHHRFY